MTSNITALQWLEAAKHRRSVYGLASTSKISKEEIQKILEETLSFAPSSYNTQPTRLTLITGEKQREFWNAIQAVAEPILRDFGESVWAQMGPRFEAFKGAHGSVLFWESEDSIKMSQQFHPAAAHMFNEFSDHTNGMHQILVWTALEIAGLGANLQHMQALPGVEDAIKKFCDVPNDWKLKAHLNFGDEAQEHPPVPQKLEYSKTLQVL